MATLVKVQTKEVFMTSLIPASRLDLCKQVFSVLPEVENLRTYASKFFIHFHSDDHIDGLSKFFLQLCEDNQTQLKDLKPLQKAQSLFKFYKKLVLNVLQEKKDFSDTVNQIAKEYKLSKEDIFPLALEVLVDGIDFLHTPVPSCALEKTFNVDIGTFTQLTQSQEQQNIAFVASKEAESIFNSLLKSS